MGDQVRVVLWSIPRTVSTAFEKCMSTLDDVQIIHEPYASAYHYGPEKIVIPSERSEDKIFTDMANEAVQADYDRGWDSETATFKYVKEIILEAQYPGKKVVFAKCMSYCIASNLDMLPNGYRHVFLIRKPISVLPSWKKLINKFPKMDGQIVKMVGGENHFVPKYYGFGESLHLYEHLVKTGIDPNPLIIDSDDLLKNPKSILQQLCDLTGIVYTDNLLNWKSGDTFQEWKAFSELVKANKIFGLYRDAFESTSFYKPKPELKRSELDDDVSDAIDVALPYYEKLYKLRLTP